MLLSITTLAIADIIEEEEVNLVPEPEYSSQWKEKAAGGKCRRELVSCLQTLGHYESLLVPPVSVISSANQAAVKAMMFVSGLTGSGHLEPNSIFDKNINCCKLNLCCCKLVDLVGLFDYKLLHLFTYYVIRLSITVSC